MKVFLFALILLTTTVGYAQIAGKSDASAKPIGVGGQEAEVGKYTDEEVKSLKVSLGNLQFPVAEGTVARLLQHPLKALRVEFCDWMPDREKKGRVGGNIVEYWLSEGYVLKVATAYYSKDDKHFSLEEWAVVLTKAEHEKFSRPIY